MTLMSFLLQKIDRPRVTLLEVKAPRLLIGRGTNAHLRSENAAVALEHAVVEKRRDIGYEVADRGSITGTYVNERPIERQVLAAGDRIEIGDLLLTVQVADPTRPLFLRVEKVRKEEAEEPLPRRPDTPVFQIGSEMRAPKIDFSKAYGLPHGFLSKRGITLLLLLLAAVAVTIATIAGGRTVYQPGSISVAHATATRPDGTRVIGPRECEACHVPFGGASNAKCNECHRQLFHQAVGSEVGPCIDCHAEHRAVPRLAAVQERECIECHRRLEGEQIRSVRSITSFEEDHPELKVVLADGRRLEVGSEPVRSGDPIALKFDHQCHLSGDCNVRPPTPEDPRRVKVELTCRSCHELDPKSGSAVRVRYEEVCARCHPLTFDNRFAPVPHGLTLEAVAGVIANAYAGNEGLLSKSPSEIARIFATRRTRGLDTGSLVVRNAQRVMEVRCAQCHLIEPEARKVVPVGKPASWFRGMRAFDHNAHMAESLELKCVDCHGAVEKSHKAVDLALPSIEDCVGCHRSSRTFAGQGLGNCIMCHYYHEATERLGPGWTARVALSEVNIGSGPDEESGSPEKTERGGGWVFFMAAIWTMFAIGGIIVAAIVVVVAAAAFTAARRERRLAKEALAEIGADTGGVGRSPKPVEPAESKPKPPEPPKPPPSPAPAESAEPAAEEPAAPAPERESPPSDRTVAVPFPSEPAEPQLGGGTMMIEWRGSLVSVAGKLQGKRFPISSEGFYIGRDKEMSKVVVEDERISRRHVWVGVEEDSVVAIDQGSTNGTYIDGERIEKRVLNEGDILVLADQVISLKYEP